ncbi:hypothetical protein Tco_1311699 [Tanacetum coccineum]
MGRDKAKNELASSTSSSAGVVRGFVKMLVKELANAITSLFLTKQTKSDAYVEMKQKELKMKKKKYKLQQQMFDFQQEKQNQYYLLFYLSSDDHLTKIKCEKVLELKQKTRK